MATWGPGNSEADVAARVDTAIAAGLGDHLPIGNHPTSSAVYRSAIRFPKPVWADWTSVTKATLTFYISDFQHIGIRNSAIYIRRTPQASPWTKSAGTQSCESGFTGANNTQADDIAAVGTGAVSFSSGSTANAKKTVDVTALVQAYFAYDQKPVFVFDGVGGSDYTELWSREGSTKPDATLTIEYSAGTVPDPPTQVSPLDLAIVPDQTPVFTWAFNGPGPQTSARIRLFGVDGTTPILPDTGAGVVVPGAGTTFEWPATLNPGQSYVWVVYTSNATGESGQSTANRFTVLAAPVVTIVATRKMVYDPVAKVPRLVVSWSSDKVQERWRVQTAAPLYDSGWQTGAATSLTLPVTLTDNVPVNVTVSVEATGIAGSATRAFNPRFGLTVHRRDLNALGLPTSWINADVDRVIPTDADLRMQYGGSASAGAAPDAWFDDIGQVPFGLRYVFWKALFIPSATQGPTLNRVTINYTTGVVSALQLDKWSTTRGGAAFAAPWKVSTDEYVYGTRSANADMRGAAAASVLYSQPILLRQDRSYILTGLMKSVSNSGACFELVDSSGNPLVGGGILEPEGPVRSETLIAERNWYDPTVQFDTIRYRTVVYKSKGETVYVALKVNGVIGSQAWFDAIKLEESTVATPWSPASLGAVVIDAGGVQVDGPKGGIFRYKAGPLVRDVVEGGTRGLKFGGDSGELYGEDTSLIVASGYLGSGSAAGTRGMMGPGNIELTAANPFIDFKDNPADDFDARIWMPTPGMLEVVGGWKTSGLERTGGAAFPTVGLADGDTFFRTDLGMEFFRSGGRWLSTELFRVDLPAMLNGAVTATVQGLAISAEGSDILLVGRHTSFFVSGGTALSGANSWVGTLRKVDAANADTVVDTCSITSGTLSAYRRITSAPNVLMTSASFFLWRTIWTKTGTPGNLTVMDAFTYRIVAV